MLLAGKEEGQILLFALLPFPCSRAGTFLLQKRKENKEHCLFVQQTTAQSRSGLGTPPRETTGVKEVSIAVQPPVLKL